jgi:hypothetical protein
MDEFDKEAIYSLSLTFVVTFIFVFLFGSGLWGLVHILESSLHFLFKLAAVSAAVATFVAFVFWMDL